MSIPFVGIPKQNRSFPTYSKHTVAAAVVVAIVAHDVYVCLCVCLNTLYVSSIASSSLNLD